MAERQPGTVECLRAFREEQDLDKNRAGILALANREDLGRVEFVEEKASGRIAKRYGTTPANLSNWLGKNEIKKPEA